MPPPEIDTLGDQVVTIKTRRGYLKVGPHGSLDGLWTVVERELLTNGGVRRLCNISTRQTLIRWRETQQFPTPVLSIDVGRPHPAELWSRSQVEDWLSERAEAALDD